MTILRSRCTANPYPYSDRITDQVVPALVLKSLIDGCRRYATGQRLAPDASERTRTKSFFGNEPLVRSKTRLALAVTECCEDPRNGVFPQASGLGTADRTGRPQTSCCVQEACELQSFSGPHEQGGKLLRIGVFDRGITSNESLANRSLGEESLPLLA